ncbi:MAG: single-stranded DNA-binding protein [Bacillota bacterium]|nr:single-stranded DNA-binding protein [Bacillota bacterium]
MINSVTFNGRLVKDPIYTELENDNAITRFTVAVQRNFKNINDQYDADFIPCYTFGRGKGKAYVNNLKKGSLVGIKGHVRSRKVEKDGVVSYLVEVEIEDVDFLSPKTSTESQSNFQFNQDPLA